MEVCWLVFKKITTASKNNWIHVIQRILVPQTTHTVLLSNCCPIAVLIRFLDHLSTEESGSTVNAQLYRNCAFDKNAGTLLVSAVHASPGNGQGRWDTCRSSFGKHHALPCCTPLCPRVMPLVGEVQVGQRGRGGGEGSAWWCFLMCLGFRCSSLTGWCENGQTLYIRQWLQTNSIEWCLSATFIGPVAIYD